MTEPSQTNADGAPAWVRRIESAFEWATLVAALATIPAIILDMNDPSTFSNSLDWAIWLTFAAQVIVMLAISPRRWQWFRSHLLLVVIVVLTVPIAPASMKALRTLRLLRLLRLLFVFAGLRRMQRLFTPSGLQYGAVIAIVTIATGGAALVTLEPDQDLSVWEGTWWAFGAATTSGSDITPESVGGRVLGVIVTMVGLAFVAQITAAVAQRFLATHDRHDELTLEHLQEQLQRIERRMNEARPPGPDPFA